jgi:hypothetical protein
LDALTWASLYLEGKLGDDVSGIRDNAGTVKENVQRGDEVHQAYHVTTAGTAAI